MASSRNNHVHSSDAMHAGGFTSRGDTARCIICQLEVSDWTQDMDPFTIHLERSPDCVVVRRTQSSNHYKTSSLSTIDPISQRPSKRQKIDIEYSLNEMNGLKRGRHRTFSHWSYPTFFCSRMIEAGFFGCNRDDRVICIYCNLICQQWDIKIDDPCEVHQILSPNCQYVKSMSDWHSLKYNTSLPSYIHYLDPEKRLASFSTWSNDDFPSIDKLVEAGFFYENSKIICFYCNGSFQNWESNNPPIAEHVRWFPHCNYARQLCGEELYHKIQQSIKSLPRNLENSELKNDHNRLNVSDDVTLLKLVSDRLDLPISKDLVEKKGIKRSTLERCWMDQLRIKNDDFLSGTDLHIACDILQKQIDNTEKNIIIPRISLKEFYEKKERSLLNQSYSEISQSFDNDHQTYKNIRQNLQFTEDKIISIKREESLDDWLCIAPSKSDMIKGGWILSETKDYSKCPHCHMEYYHWKSDDNPLLIHKYLSPLCLFVLSLNPFHPIPIKKIHEQFTDEDIENANSQPYNGLVQTRYQSIFSIADRRTSFERFPANCPINSDELATSGFYYFNCARFIKCYYCKYTILLSNCNSRSNRYLIQLHLSTRCRYIRQLNDNDRVHITSNQCPCCMKEEKRLMALPCRHFCLCQSCGQIKRLCSICKKDVTTYVIIYPG